MKRLKEKEARFEEKVERFQKKLERDPYSAVFGRRHEPLGGWSGFVRSFWGFGESADGKVKRDSEAGGSGGSAGAKDVRQGRDKENDLEFDPITGRMVSRAKVVGVDGVDVSAKASAGASEAYASDLSSGGESRASSAGTMAHAEQEGIAQTLEGKEFVDAKTNDQKETPQASDALNGNEVPRVIMAEPPKPENDLSSEQGMDSVQGEASRQWLQDHTNTRDDFVTRPPVLTEDDTTEHKPSNSSQRNIPRQEADDLESLSASDIRASYNSKRAESENDAQKQEIRRALEDELDCYLDPASGIDAHDIRGRYHHCVPGLKADEVSTSEGKLQNLDHPKIEANESTPRPALESDQSTSQVFLSPALYRILAYDSSTLQVTRADTSSSQQAANEARHPTEVLSRLNNVAKFLPYFAGMHHDGYEIVSGGGDILVFKKVREASQKPGEATAAIGADPTTPEVPSLETGYPDDLEFIQNGAAEQINIKEPQARTVQGQETVYTGSPPNWSPYPPLTHHRPMPGADSPPPEKHTFGKTVRGMLLAGGITAATCYAIGVVSEYFRTGGQDGYGIDGFTEFESERRRRDG